MLVSILFTRSISLRFFSFWALESLHTNRNRMCSRGAPGCEARAARAISLERRCASAVSRRWDLIVSFSNVEDELERYGFTPASTRRRSSPT